MSDLLKTLTERGFIRQNSDPTGLAALLSEGPATGYIGFDPTADSLHVGSLLQIMTLAHLQRCGHRPIAIVGGGTTLIGDPSGKTELRQMLTRENIASNAQAIQRQLSRFIDFGAGRALLVNNADWLCPFSYIDFLRDVGRHFSVNHMLAQDSVKLRLEKGLSFIEFNYSILQAYDFMYLNRHHGCRLQLGGDDQWGNIVAGIDLTRRLNQQQVYGLTTPLVTTASGAKMGKTAQGAVWLDAARTSPYDFYQYWINTHDADVERFLLFFTFIPLDEVRRLGSLHGAELNEAKRVLAHAVTSLVHGTEAAEQAVAATRAAFGGESDRSAMPTVDLSRSKYSKGLTCLDLLLATGLVASKSQGRSLIEQGGAYLNEERMAAFDAPVALDAGEWILRSGKKKRVRVRAVD